jgi:hypothetical protein
MFPKDKDAQISRFWEKYIEKSKRYGIKQSAVRWHVKHAEQYIKAHKTQLKAHVALDLDKYLQDKGRNTQLKEKGDVTNGTYLTRIFHRNAEFWGNLSGQFFRFVEKHNHSYGYRRIGENGH